MVLPSSEHHIDGAPRYDHEFGGFTKKLARETARPLSPGQYTIKIVIQDVGTNTEGNDLLVDSALFIEEESFRLFPLAQGDYNGDGCVDQADYVVWSKLEGASPADFFMGDGDGDGDCDVDEDDYDIWFENSGTSGNRNFAADANRDGDVDDEDLNILLSSFNTLDECASRFEGDADQDGDVDDGDLNIMFTEWNLPTCGCCEGESALAGGESDPGSRLKTNPDANNDGVIDQEELAAVKAILQLK